MSIEGILFPVIGLCERMEPLGLILFESLNFLAPRNNDDIELVGDNLSKMRWKLV